MAMKRIMKRGLSLVLAFGMVVSFPGFAYAAESGDETGMFVAEESTETTAGSDASGGSADTAAAATDSWNAELIVEEVVSVAEGNASETAETAGSDGAKSDSAASEEVPGADNTATTDSTTGTGASTETTVATDTDASVESDAATGTDTSAESDAVTDTDTSMGNDAVTGTDTSTESDTATGTGTSVGSGKATGTDTSAESNASTDAAGSSDSDAVTGAEMTGDETAMAGEQTDATGTAEDAGTEESTEITTETTDDELVIAVESETADTTSESAAAEGNLVSCTDADGNVYTASADDVVLSAISVSVGELTENEDGSVSIIYEVDLYDETGALYTGAANVTIPMPEAFEGYTSFTAVVYNEGEDVSEATDVEVSVEDAEEYFAEVVAVSDDASTVSDTTAESGNEIALPTEGEILSLEVPHFSTIEVTALADTSSVTEDTTRDSKPENGTTTGQPFSSGTGGSTYFRIPAMVTLDDGKIIAAADARWDGSSDGYGLDTIVSYSTDDGATWNYTFANYLGDNGNSLNSSSTAFIDPSLATDGETVYMLVDLYPGVTVISNAQAGTGYDSNGHLLLSDDGGTSYAYYVGDYEDGYANIYTEVDGVATAIDHYTVDEYFYLYYDDTCISNVFFSDCDFTVLPTSYLYLTTSTDGGATWSAPTMLNSQVKSSTDYFYGVGPGSGLTVTLDDGTVRILFACYTYSNGSDGNTSVIYSDDGGKTWTRSADMSEQSSEATMVEADGTIYMFTRHGGYYYSTDNGTTWSSKQTVSGISYTTSCQLNAMVYSEKIDGCTAILLSAPTSNRTTGKIFVGLVQDDGSINWEYTYSVNGSGTYQYSCLAELSDGTVALLYENGGASITYTTLDIEDIASGAEIGTASSVSMTVDGIGTVTASITSSNGTKLGGISIIKKSSDTSTVDGWTIVDIVYEISLTDTEGNAYTGEATITMPTDSDFGDYTNFSGSVAASDSGDEASFAVNLGEDEDGTSMLTFTVPHFSEVTISATDSTITETVDVTLYVGQSVSYENTAAEADGNIDTAIATAEVDSADYDAMTGEDSSLSDSYVNLSYALYTFSGSTDEGWVISNTSTGTTLYVNIDNSSNGFPNNTTSDTLTLTYVDSYFTITNGSGRNLCFLTDSGTPYFDEGGFGATSDSDYVKLLIYRPAGDGDTESAELPGYVRVTSVNEISSGSQYLIVAYRNSTYYALYPSLSTSDKYSHVARALGEIVTKSTVTFTGVAAGTTAEVVGSTKYNITVLAVPTSGTTVTSDVTPFVSGGTNASDAGSSSGKSMTRLTLSQGLSFDVDIDSSWEYSTIYWSIADTSIATVDQDGTVTAVSVGETVLIATIDGVSYEIPIIVVDYTDNTGEYHASSGYIIYDLYITEITNTTVYYSVNLSTDLVECYEGEVLYISVDLTYDSCIDFFAKPDDGYALTNIGSTNSATDYMSLIRDEDGNTVTDPTQTEFYTLNGAAGYNQAHTYNWKNDTLIEMIQAAMDAGCEAGLGFTRKKSGTSDCNSSLSFISEKLPDIEKLVYQVIKDGTDIPVDYTSSTEIQTGDTIIFKIVVTRYATRYGINYSAGLLTDTMNDDRVAYFATLEEESGTYTTGTSSTNDITDDLSEANVTVTKQDDSTTVDASQEEGVYTYYVTYTVTDDDVDKNLINYVTLDYTYRSYYSSGSGTAEASASASVMVSSFVPKDIIVDFGLSVTVDYSGVNDHGNYNLASGTAEYGDVTVSGNIVTYTPTSVLQGVDTVTLTNTEGGEYTFQVYPATTVYYEQGFATYGTGWTTASGGDWSNTGVVAGTQQTHYAGVENNSFNNYGYDNAYADTTSTSAASTSTKGDSLTFTFTGTGVDIFANCDNGSGVVGIKVTDSNGSSEKMLTVNMADVGSYATGTGSKAYNTPIASISGLTYGTHTVTIYLASSGSSGFNFDGFRVYGTIDESSDAATKAVYTADLEDNPSYYELRNNVLAGLDVNTSSSTYADDLANSLAQVYASSETGTGAIVVYDSASSVLQTEEESETETESETEIASDEGDAATASDEDSDANDETEDSSDAETTDSSSVLDLLDNGPKNELYLYPGMTVVFKITTNRQVQIGLRSVTGAAVSYTITSGSATTTGSINSSVDMFYDLVAKSDSGSDTAYTITISVPSTSSGILSITDIKVSDYSGSLFGTLTADEAYEALTGTAYSGSVEDTENPEDTDDGSDTGDVGESDGTEDSGGSIETETDVAPVLACANLTVNLVDASGTGIASVEVVSSETGKVGEMAVITVSEILTAAKEVLPDGYVLADESSIADQSVAYGESAAVDVRIGKVATLVVTYQKYSGLLRKTTGGTATLTKVQTSAETEASFSADEIRTAVPDGYRVLIAASSKVSYGATGTKTVTVY